jgi:hypothetical protein
VVRESVPPKPRTQSFPRASLLDFPSVLPPISDIKLPDAQHEPYQSIEDASDKGDKEEEEGLDYNIEWKVFIGKEPLLSDIISRSNFWFATLCGKAKEKT